MTASFTGIYQIILAVSLITAISQIPAESKSSMGPLRVCPENPRYFMRPDGKAVLLTGSHTWSVLQNMGREDPPHTFDFDAYLKWIRKYGHNFIRGWRFEFTEIDSDELTYTFQVSPQPWARTGPGLAMDGKPRFDLTKFDESYFDMLRSRVLAAREHGVYISIMVFCGWGVWCDPPGWKNNPFNAANNINGINGDLNNDGLGGETHTLANSKVVEIQKTYVKKVIDTVNDLDNVLYEICNETPLQIDGYSSTEWQYDMIRFIKEYEKTKPCQHPVGMTYQFSSQHMNPALFASPAEWISPNRDGGYRDNPQVNDGQKVILNDTDHLWGIGGNASWVWKSVMRGLNPIFMDPYDGVVLGNSFDPDWEPIRKNMGYVQRFARRMNLNRMKPMGELTSSGFCLANPGNEYLVYLPGGKEITVDLSGVKGSMTVEWMDTSTGKLKVRKSITSGNRTAFKSPFTNSGSVLYLKRK